MFPPVSLGHVSRILILVDCSPLDLLRGACGSLLVLAGRDMVGFEGNFVILGEVGG